MTSQLMRIDFSQRLMAINLGDDMKVPAFWIIRIRVLNWFWYVGYKAKKFVINKMG